MLASGDNKDKTIKLWDVATGTNTATLTGFKETVVTLAFSPDGKILASGSWIKPLFYGTWPREKTSLLCWATPGTFGHVDFAPDGKMLASGSPDNVIKLWDIASGKCIADLTGPHKLGIRCIAFSRDGAKPHWAVAVASLRYGMSRRGRTSLQLGLTRKPMFIPWRLAQWQNPRVG